MNFIWTYQLIGLGCFGCVGLIFVSAILNAAQKEVAGRWRHFDKLMSAFQAVMSRCDDRVYSCDPMCEFSSSPVQNLSKIFENCASPEFYPYDDSSVFTSSTAEDHGDIIDSCMDDDSLSAFASPWRPAKTPASREHSSFWNSAIGTSLTPVASSTMAPGASRRPSYRSSGLLPIPFDCEKIPFDLAEDESAVGLPTTPPAEPSSATDQVVRYMSSHSQPFTISL